MHALVHGIDLVDVDRIARLMDEHGARFLERVFTEAERAYALDAPKTRDERLAARFAAKEAVLKALGTGWRGGIAWTDVEVTRSASGEPGVRLSGRAAEVAAERGVASWLLSLTHTSGFASASAIGLGG
jgi:holo-[acyl-carrier protein] synthase